MIQFLSPGTGIVNRLIQAFGGSSIPFLQEERYFKGIVVVTDIWKGAGWGTILYLSALTGIDPEIYEAAKIDGANRFQRVIFITLPAISGTILTVFILNLAKVLNLFDSVWVLQNSMVLGVSDVIETYVYRMGITSADYGMSTAAGLFKSVVSVLLVTIANKISKKVKGEGVLG